MSKRKQNKLQLGIRAEQLPRSVTPFQYFKTLLDSVNTDSDLPRGWDVKIRWRNPDAGRIRRWQEDDLMDAVSQSNDGFRSALRGMLTAYRNRAWGVLKKRTVKKKQMKIDVETMSRLARKIEQRKKTKALIAKWEEEDLKKERKKRSAAAKRGWKTRRANERKRAKKRTVRATGKR